MYTLIPQTRINSDQLLCGYEAVYYFRLPIPILGARNVPSVDRSVDKMPLLIRRRSVTLWRYQENYEPSPEDESISSYNFTLTIASRQSK
jgi:hypothetical protein